MISSGHWTEKKNCLVRTLAKSLPAILFSQIYRQPVDKHCSHARLCLDWKHMRVARTALHKTRQTHNLLCDQHTHVFYLQCTARNSNCCTKRTNSHMFSHRHNRRSAHREMRQLKIIDVSSWIECNTRWWRVAIILLTWFQMSSNKI